MEATRKLVLLPEEQYEDMKRSAEEGRADSPPNGERRPDEGGSESSAGETGSTVSGAGESASASPPSPPPPPPPPSAAPTGEVTEGAYQVERITAGVPQKRVIPARRLLTWLRVKRLLGWREDDGTLVGVKGLRKKPPNITDVVKDTQAVYKKPPLTERERSVLKRVLRKAKTPDFLLGNPYYKGAGVPSKAKPAKPPAATSAPQPAKAAPAAGGDGSEVRWRSI